MGLVQRQGACAVGDLVCSVNGVRVRLITPMQMKLPTHFCHSDESDLAHSRNTFPVLCYEAFACCSARLPKVPSVLQQSLLGVGVLLHCNDMLSGTMSNSAR